MLLSQVRRPVVLFQEVLSYDWGSSKYDCVRLTLRLVVLLRVLEYYEGILILTTNRINSFDVAVQSRVHVAIRYDNLDPTQTRDIYLTFLQQVKDDGNIADWKALSEWVNVQSRNSDFNGRQIRNVVSSALGLARAKKDKLNTEYLDKIVDRTRTFHKLLSKQRQMFEMKQIAGGQER